ncbi:general transcription factor II-I repeat domain-containing protein 2A [Trichonephila clavipes]|nr:general transcription factor II-I repeat domain-containing protein 2A [Trichonephila clavipes]
MFSKKRYYNKKLNYFPNLKKNIKDLDAQEKENEEKVIEDFISIMDFLRKEFSARFSQFKELSETFKFIMYPDVISFDKLNLSQFDWLEIEIEELEMQLIDFQSSSKWIQKFIETRKKLELIEAERLTRNISKNTSNEILETWNSIPDSFNCLKKLAYAILTIFSSTYTCESLFSEINHIKDSLRNRLTVHSNSACILLKRLVYKCLLRHLQIQHNISKATQSASPGSQNTEITKRKIDSDNDIRIISEQKKPLLSYFLKEKKETLEEIVSKLVCVDGFTVNAITKSNFIRKSLHDKGYSFPPDPSDVMKLEYKQYNVIKARVTNEISSKLNAGLRCSLTLDEFTSLKNRRYLNINVHFNEGEIFNLGMLRISGSFSAENCVKAVETKLQEYGIITEKHMVASVTDGASMMVKYGKIMSCEYHLCYAHAIHLAVCDVLYNKQIDLVENTVEEEDKSHEEENDESEELVENLDKALDVEFESGVGTDALFHVTYAEKNFITNINKTIKKIRNVVKNYSENPL